MLRRDFHFELPKELIAQTPTPERSASRLLELDGCSGRQADLQFRDLPTLLRPNDLLIFNDTRVIPARIFGFKQSGGRVEILLERALGPRTALVHVRGGKALRAGTLLNLAADHTARMLERDGELFVLEFSTELAPFFESHGAMPLPPYIARDPQRDDRERYQTLFARRPGAVAAPTAGLHFDAAIFAALEQRGIRHAFLTLHVGAGTFAPMRVEHIDAHQMHSEYLEVPQQVCDAIHATRVAGGRVVAVGTTVVRALESASGAQGLRPTRGMTRIFITPGFRFGVVDALLTNFHLPQSTLLMLCAAFVGRETLLRAYAHAVAARYRFFSYGDAMFLTPAAPRAYPADAV